MQIHELRQPLNEVDLVGPGGLFRGIKQAATAARTPAGRAALKQQMVSSAPLVDPKTGQATPTAYAQISKNIQDDKRVNDFKDRTWSNWTNHYARSTPAGPAAITNFSKFFDDWIDQHLMATDMPMDKLDPQERAKFEQVKNLAASRFSPRNTAGFRAELDRVIDAAFAAMSATRLKAQLAPVKQPTNPLVAQRLAILLPLPNKQPTPLESVQPNWPVWPDIFQPMESVSQYPAQAAPA